MIITVSLNPSIDRTLSVQGFEYGGTNRVIKARDDAGGKATNLALVASALGAKAMCVGLLPEMDGAITRARLDAAGVKTAFVQVPGRLRVNIKLLDEAQGAITEINERGCSVDAASVDELTRLVFDTVGPGDVLVLTGSMPPGINLAYYAELARCCKGKCRCAIDAEGEPLELGVRENPDLIKPNRHELELLVGRKLSSLGEIASAAQEIQSSGVGAVCVTMGGEGAVYVDAEGALFAPALKLKARSTVGAGDSMLAGLLCGLQQGKDRMRAFAMGVAAAAASVVSEGTSLVDANVYWDMMGRTTIQRL